MVDSELLEELRRIVGPEQVCTDRLTAEVYSYDASLATGAPDAVAFPGDTAETAAVVRAASKTGVPCTPRGFGTNLSGGSVAPEGGVVVCLTRMNRILAIRPEHRSAVVQPGVTNFELQQALAPLGFFFAPDPTESSASIGGMASCNARGVVLSVLPASILENLSPLTGVLRALRPAIPDVCGAGRELAHHPVLRGAALPATAVPTLTGCHGVLAQRLPVLGEDERATIVIRGGLPRRRSRRGRRSQTR